MLDLILGGVLEASWKPLGAILGGIWEAKMRPRRPKMVPRRRLGRLLWPPVVVLGRLGASWGRLGASWGVLARLGGFLGASLGRFGASGCVLKAFWGVFGASWGVSRRHLGTPLGRAERRHAVPSKPRRSVGIAIKRHMRENRERGREEDKMLLHVFSFKRASRSLAKTVFLSFAGVFPLKMVPRGS